MSVTHLSEAEWKVMEAVWKGAPVTTREVLERLGDETDWAYTTVKTMLARLSEKGVLEVTKRSNVSFYHPKLSRAEARQSAVRSLLNRAFGGAMSPLLQFLLNDDQLTDRDRAELEQWLNRQKSDVRGGQDDA